jgi:hypothetical protein
VNEQHDRIEVHNRPPLVIYATVFALAVPIPGALCICFLQIVVF